MEHTILKNVLRFLKSRLQQVCSVYTHDDYSPFYRLVLENEEFLRSLLLNDECKAVAHEILEVLEVNKESFSCVSTVGRQHALGTLVILKKIYKNLDPVSSVANQEHPITWKFKKRWMNNTLTFLKSNQAILRYPDMLRGEAEYIYNSILGLTECGKEESLWAPVWEAMKIYMLRYEYIVSLNAVELMCMRFITFEKVKIERSPVKSATKYSPAVGTNESSVIKEQLKGQIHNSLPKSDNDLSLTNLFMSNGLKGLDKNTERVINTVKNGLEIKISADVNASKDENILNMTNNDMIMSLQEPKPIDVAIATENKVEFFSGEESTDILVHGNKENGTNEDEKLSDMLQNVQNSHEAVSKNPSKLSDTKSDCVLIEHKDSNIIDLPSPVRDTGDNNKSDKYMDKTILTDERDSVVGVSDKSYLRDCDIFGEFNSKGSQESDQNLTERTEFNSHNVKNLNEGSEEYNSHNLNVLSCNDTNIEAYMNLNNEESEILDEKDAKNSCVTICPITAANIGMNVKEASTGDKDNKNSSVTLDLSVLQADVGMNVNNESQNVDKEDNNSCDTMTDITAEIKDSEQTNRTDTLKYDMNNVSVATIDNYNDTNNKKQSNNNTSKDVPYVMNTDTATNTVNYSETDNKKQSNNKTSKVVPHNLNTDTAPNTEIYNETDSKPQSHNKTSKDVSNKLNLKPNIVKSNKKPTHQPKPANVKKEFIINTFSSILDFINNDKRYTLRIGELKRKELDFLLEYKRYDPDYSCEVLFDGECKQLLEKSFKALKEKYWFRLEVCKGGQNKCRKRNKYKFEDVDDVLFSVLFKKVERSKSSRKKLKLLLTEKAEKEPLQETSDSDELETNEELYLKPYEILVEETVYNNNNNEKNSDAGDCNSCKDLPQIRVPYCKPKPNRVTKMTENLIQGLAKPVEVDKAIRMMRLMGWQGGSLGVRGNGLMEPIQPNIDRLCREGLRHKEECTQSEPAKGDKYTREKKIIERKKKIKKQ